MCFFHAYSAVMAMRAGKHVYVEKPCAYCPSECMAIRETWKRTANVRSSLMSERMRGIISKPTAYT